MELSNKIWLSVGGNLENTAGKFDRLWQLIEKHIGSITATSPYYKSEPWGFVSEHPFVNTVARVTTTLSPIEALHISQKIEKMLGRENKSHNGIYSDRSMDIDIIAYNDIVLRNDELEIPHPRMHLRRFVLQPLYDIQPDWIHPLFHKKITTLLEECTDNSELEKMKNPVLI